MSTPTIEFARASSRASVGARRSAAKDTWWLLHREASLNWLALGLLLAAWNTTDDAAARVPRRPAALRGYPVVSVRAAALQPWRAARQR